MKLRDLIKKAKGALGVAEKVIPERREARGRRRSDRELIPPIVKYGWAVLVTVLILTSTVLGENSKYAETLDYLIRSLTGVSLDQGGREGTNQ